jgi:two-component system, OmpR family, phosphate regulon sensor histidine kinase PhoR
MDGLLSRILKAWLCVGGLALVGAALAAGLVRVSGAGQWGATLGVVLGVVVVLVYDARRAERLAAWLRSGHATGAPRDGGFWGELGYRVEKGLRQRDLQVSQERERLQQFLLAIEASPNGVMLLDANDHIEWCNQVAAQHFGLDPQRDRLQRITNLVRVPAFVAYLQAGVFDEPVVFSDTAGRTTLSVLVRPYGESRKADPRGGDGLKLVLTQDITDRERVETMRREFVANVSHEIRTPLTVLAGFIETMAGLPLSEVERQRVLVLMAQQAGRMQSLVEDLLTLAQLEGSQRPATDQWVNLPGLLQRALADAKALSGQRHHFVHDVPPGLELAGSEREVLSAVSNLLTNAVRYTPQGGQISLLCAVSDGGELTVEVADTGIGIAREHLPRLTERFYRVDGSRSRETGGTGLGLSIVKHVMQRHGGDVDVRSEAGKGSVFRLRWPAVRVRRTAAFKDAGGAAQPQARLSDADS